MDNQIIKRIGNTIDINIVVNDGADLSTVLGFTPNYEIEIVKAYGRTYDVPNSSITADTTTGTFSFKWKAGNQYGVGDYTLVLRLYEVNDKSEETGDFRTVDMTQAIRLTKHTCQGTDEGSQLNIKFEI